MTKDEKISSLINEIEKRDHLIEVANSARDKAEAEFKGLKHSFDLIKINYENEKQRVNHLIISIFNITKEKTK